ncbi:MAG: TAXI family TRAP transporter solute-binding subunit [Calditrichaeota bacterium]|nr:TAXI family TRAP transporter solute-binding subunit [Calditrichota bacterium]
MQMRLRRLFPLGWLSASLLLSCSSGSRTEFVTIGTGGMTGVYYPVGGAIAKLLNDRVDQFGLKATVQSTGGSVFNINALMSGDLEFGIAQSDLQYQAVKGTGEWDGKPHTGLRSLFSLHSEIVTLIASDPSGIWKPVDMKGKRVAIGPPGSGMRRNAIDALAIAGLSLSDIKAEDLQPVECAGMLQDGRIDAYFYTVGHPNGSIKEAVAGTTPVHFVPFDDVGTLYQDKPYYTPAVIDIAPYPGVTNKEPVPSFGVKATMVTSAKVTDNAATGLVKVVFDNFEDFRALHPALGGLEMNRMLEGLTAQLHPAAEKFYRERGLLQ